MESFFFGLSPKFFPPVVVEAVTPGRWVEGRGWWTCLSLPRQRKTEGKGGGGEGRGGNAVIAFSCKT